MRSQRGASAEWRRRRRREKAREKAREKPSDEGREKASETTSEKRRETRFEKRREKRRGERREKRRREERRRRGKTGVAACGGVSGEILGLLGALQRCGRREACEDGGGGCLASIGPSICMRWPLWRGEAWELSLIHI